MNGEKAFVVACDLELYAAIVRLWKLDPGLCFWCPTPERAARDIITNQQQGIPAAMWTVAGRWSYDLETSRAAWLERKEAA